MFEIATDEGRWTPTNGYEYFLKDHRAGPTLRNVRVAFNATGVTQYSDYDPWGLPLPGLVGGSSTNRSQFNGKEAISEQGAAQYDFEARGLDSWIGRMRTPDPMAEATQMLSPFMFANNNPLRFIDPTGMIADESEQYRYYSDGYGLRDAANGGRIEQYGGFMNAQGESMSSGGGPGPGPKSKLKSPLPQATIQTYQPDMLDQWRESGNVFGQMTYGFADGLYALSKILTFQRPDRHLGGQGYENANDAMMTSIGGISTAAGPLIGALGSLATKSATFYRAMSSAEYAALEANNGLTYMTGKELFVSSSANYSRAYLQKAGYDVLVQFNMKPGAMNYFNNVGVLHRTPAASSGWAGRGNLLWKSEQGAMNLGIQQNTQMFNSWIKTFKTIK